MAGREGVTRDEIRAALHILQDSRCAVCSAEGKLVVDHDHATGLARGLLCRGCNVREGGPILHSDIEAYRKNPPAAGRGWFWDLPDTWTVEDTAAIRRQLGGRHGAGMPIPAILEYMPQHLEHAAARRAVVEEAAIAY